MKISTLTWPIEKRVGRREAIRMIAEAGFEAIDYTMLKPEQEIFSPSRDKVVRELKSVADSYGIPFNQAHSLNPSWRYGADESENENRKRCVLESVEIAAELGAKTVIVHPIAMPDSTPAEQREFNLDFYCDVLERSSSVGITVAIENMWGRHRDRADMIVPSVCSTAEEMCDYIDELDSPYVTACLDLGHAGLVGYRADAMIRTLGSRLTALHIHDNDFREDLHSFPYFGKMNYPKIIEALREVGYSGDITFEPSIIFENIPTDLFPAALRFLREIGEHLRRELKK